MERGTLGLALLWGRGIWPASVMNVSSALALNIPTSKGQSIWSLTFMKDTCVMSDRSASLCISAETTVPATSCEPSNGGSRLLIRNADALYLSPGNRCQVGFERLDFMDHQKQIKFQIPVVGVRVKINLFRRAYRIS